MGCRWAFGLHLSRSLPIYYRANEGEPDEAGKVSTGFMPGMDILNTGNAHHQLLRAAVTSCCELLLSPTTAAALWLQGSVVEGLLLQGCRSRRGKQRLN